MDKKWEPRKLIPADPEKVARIRQLAAEGKVECAPTDEVDLYDATIERFLKVFGHTEYLITDESSLGDFDPTAEEVAHAEEEFGITLNPDDTLVAIAKRISGKEEP